MLLIAERTPEEKEDPDLIGTVAVISECLAGYQDVGVDEFIVRDHVDTPVGAATESLTTLGHDVLPGL